MFPSLTRGHAGETYGRSPVAATPSYMAQTRTSTKRLELGPLPALPLPALIRGNYHGSFSAREFEGASDAPKNHPTKGLDGPGLETNAQRNAFAPRCHPHLAQHDELYA